MSESRMNEVRAMMRGGETVEGMSYSLTVFYEGGTGTDGEE